VTYEIELLKPKLVEAEGALILADKYIFTGGSNGSPIGTSQTVSSQSTLGTEIGGNQVFFPEYIQEGVYQFVWTFTGSGAVVAVAPAITGSANITILTVFGNNSVGVLTMPLTGTSTTTVQMTFYVHITFPLPDTHITFSASGTLPTSFNNGDLQVNQVNGPTYLFLLKNHKKYKNNNQNQNKRKFRTPNELNKDQMLQKLDDDLAKGKYQLTRRNLVINDQERTEWPDLVRPDIEEKDQKDQRKINHYRQVFSRANVAGEPTGHDDFGSDEEEYVLVKKPKDF
jgi:hypothetical protein